jgi:hypothetical protein
MEEFFRKLLFGDGASSFSMRGVLGLVLLAALLVLCTLGDGTGGGVRLSREEERLWDRVRAAQEVLVPEREARGIASPKEVDPWGTGLIGLEWSVVTTTLGDLEAKRTSCDPRWAVRVLRWFKEAGLAQGDRVAILSPPPPFPDFSSPHSPRRRRWAFPCCLRRLWRPPPGERTCRSCFCRTC